MACYLCGAEGYHVREGVVRDAPEREIRECDGCGIVTLDSTSHIHAAFYQESNMHGQHPQSMEAWLSETHADDLRRFEMLKGLLPNAKVLDFGCGAGGFLLRAESLAAKVTGLELEDRVRQYWKNRLEIVPGFDDLSVKYDLITAFHVVEHLHDPRAILKQMAIHLSDDGQMIIEVPSSTDALLTLYRSQSFQRFTYWSQHLFLFNAAALELLAKQAGLVVAAVKHVQRYPLSNHLHWLSKGKPGGHKTWSFLNSPELEAAYADRLAALGKTDTLVAYMKAAK